MIATGTGIASKSKGKTEKVTLNLTLSIELYEKVKQDSALSKKSISSMVEELIDSHVSLQDVSIGLATLMGQKPVREKPEPGVEMKGLIVSVSRRHHNLIRMEAMRQNTSLRALLKCWIKERYIDPKDQEAYNCSA